MSNSEIQELFEQNLKNGNYLYHNHKLSPKKVDIWFNQLSEEEIGKYLKINTSLFTILKNQTVDLCILALENENEPSIDRFFCFRFVKIVPNPDHETTLKNLYEKKAILDALK